MLNITEVLHGMYETLNTYEEICSCKLILFRYLLLL